MIDFIEELKWRGIFHDIMPGTDEQLEKEMTAAYIGFDPTSDSLHIGSLSQMITLKRFQLAGHKPVALVGGATGMIGDPSGKSQERNLLTTEILNKNLAGIRKQLEHFIDFESDIPNKAEMVNNYDWMSEFSFLEFIRDVGKHISVNYMMAKDSVKKRMGKLDDGQDASGLSFTEFSYQLVQGYDFLHLYQNNACKLQMGGSDQWGNITTGTELIRRKAGGKAYALTTKLITKSDGGKFGKTEKGNVWLDPEKTSPYEFYQFWLNTSDEDAEQFIKIFTFLTQQEIESLIEEHQQAPHNRRLQKRLAKEVTVMTHSQKAYDTAVDASEILFKNGSIDRIETLDNSTFMAVFNGVPKFEIEKNELEKGISILDLLAEKTKVFASKGELRRLMKDNGLSINQEKEKNVERVFTSSDLIKEKYILIRQGKKKYSLIEIV